MPILEPMSFGVIPILGRVEKLAPNSDPIWSSTHTQQSVPMSQEAKPNMTSKWTTSTANTSWYVFILQRSQMKCMVFRGGCLCRKTADEDPLFFFDIGFHCCPRAQIKMHCRFCWELHWSVFRSHAQSSSWLFFHPLIPLKPIYTTEELAVSLSHSR